jgi:2'-hydroxyisoflavone reductase
VIGPHDRTGRFTWWVRRIARGGEVPAPGPRDAPIQVVDARDQGEWTIRLVEGGTVGTFNSVTPTPPFGFGDLLDATISAVGSEGTTLTWVDPEWLRERGETYQSLPLWTGGTMEWTLAGNPTKTYTAGLSPRPLTETIAETWRWINDARPPLVPGWGIPEEREAKLLSDWQASS